MGDASRQLAHKRPLFGGHQLGLGGAELLQSLAQVVALGFYLAVAFIQLGIGAALLPVGAPEQQRHHQQKPQPGQQPQPLVAHGLAFARLALPHLPLLLVQGQ